MLSFRDEALQLLHEFKASETRDALEDLVRLYNRQRILMQKRWKILSADKKRFCNYSKAFT